MKIIKIASCKDCPKIASTQAEIYQHLDRIEKYLCSCTLIGLKTRYFIEIDGVSEIPVWCPLEDSL